MQKGTVNNEEKQTGISQDILNHKIKIIVPVCRAFHNMNDFSKFDNKHFDFKNDDITGSFRIYHSEEYKDDILNGIFSLQDFVNHSLWYGSKKKYQFLEFAFEITKFNETKSEENKDLSEKEWKSLLLTDMIFSCEDEYKMFVFAFFLSFPVPTSFERGIVLLDDKFYSQTEKYTDSFDSDERIDFQKCWKYLHDTSKFKFGKSQNNASRFISILSKMNEAEDIISQIFYAAMALESVFARGTSEGIARQIIDKVKIFLNTEIEEKKLKQLYDVRSNYIHGDVDIQLSFLDFDAVPENKLDKLYELFLYTSEILYIIAKRIIEENISEIDFDYDVRVSK